MTTLHKLPEPEPERRNGKRHHQVALWAGVASFFASLLAIGIFDILNPDQWAEYLGSLIVAAITGGAVYARERLAAAKRDEKPNG